MTIFVEINYKIVRRKKFRGFTNNEEFKFCKLYFNNKEAMNTYKRSLDKIHNSRIFVARA